MVIQLISLLEKQITHPDRGQDLAEYAVFIGLIALVVVVSITLIGGEIRDIFIAIATAIQRGALG